MKFIACVILLAACFGAQADCPSNLPLQGAVNIDSCDRSGGKCVRADEALHEYMEAVPDNDPESLSLGLHASPWHAYDAEYHILEIDELADIVRQQGSKIKRVVLLASWSGVAPDRKSRSLAQKLSNALNGMPVTGKDGFVWLSKDGAIHTTRQAFTLRMSGPYWVAKGDKVMASLVAGWPLDHEAQFSKSRDAEGLMRAGAAHAIFMLCPKAALKAFEASAALANPIAAYNAAIMRLERGGSGDAKVATALLKQSAAAGDKKAQAKLRSLAKTAPAT